MELSLSALQGLQVASTLPEEAYYRILNHAVHTSLGAENVKDTGADAVSQVEQASLKEAASALAKLLLEAARTDVDAAGIGALLEECKFTPERTDIFTSHYLENRAQLRATLGRVSSAIPHVVDVSWRLDYHIKGNHVERVNKPVYLIQLKTEENGDGDTGVQFACTQEQLQDLVSKLKDASKSLEKFSSN